MVERYRGRAALMGIVERLEKEGGLGLGVGERLEGVRFEPEGNGNWGEPFVGKLVLYDRGRHSELVLLNSHPKTANAPSFVFPKTLAYPEFLTFAYTHLKEK
jgi:hypothetical protein